MPLLPPDHGEPVRRAIQRCGCGVVGCASLSVTIRRVGHTVDWTDARDDVQPVELGPFLLDAAQYEREVRRAHAERPWETRDERITRLVTDAHRDLRGARPRSFDWATGRWVPGHVVVSVTDHEPNPRAGEPIGSGHADGHGWWQGIEPDDVHHQHLGMFAVDTDQTDDQAAADSIAQQVLETDPKFVAPAAAAVVSMSQTARSALSALGTPDTCQGREGRGSHWPATPGCSVVGRSSS